MKLPVKSKGSVSWTIRLPSVLELDRDLGVADLVLLLARSGRSGTIASDPATTAVITSAPSRRRTKRFTAASVAAAEVDRRGGVDLGVGGEELARLEAEGARRRARGEDGDRGVEGLDRVVVDPAGDRDPLLDRGEVALQGGEVLARLQLRVGLGEADQVADAERERSLERPLGGRARRRRRDIAAPRDSAVRSNVARSWPA